MSDDPGPPAQPGAADPLLLAVGTLTAVRVPAPRSLAAPVPGRAMMLAPLVGLIPGGLAALAAWAGAELGWNAGILAVLAVAVLALATRGLHLDGLADVADGLAASYDRERSLAVMRTGDTGPAGLATTLLVLLLQVAALAQLISAATSVPVIMAIIVAAAMVGRIAVPIACRSGVPAARPKGLGALVAGSVSRLQLVAILLLAATATTALSVSTGQHWWRGLAVLAVALLVTEIVVRRAVRRFGGITGDVIGAAVELSTMAALLALAVH